MNMWIDEKTDVRCCDRATAVELGGEKYANKDISILYHFDEFIQIVDPEDATEPGEQMKGWSRG